MIGFWDIFVPLKKQFAILSKKESHLFDPSNAAFLSNMAFCLVSLDPNTGLHRGSENSHELSDSKSKHISVATRVQTPVFV